MHYNLNSGLLLIWENLLRGMVGWNYWFSRTRVASTGPVLGLCCKHRTSTCMLPQYTMAPALQGLSWGGGGNWLPLLSQPDKGASTGPVLGQCCQHRTSTCYPNILWPQHYRVWAEGGWKGLYWAQEGEERADLCQTPEVGRRRGESELLSQPSPLARLKSERSQEPFIHRVCLTFGSTRTGPLFKGESTLVP